MTNTEQTWRYRVTEDDSKQTVHLAGEIDMLAAEQIEGVLVAAAGDGALLIDLRAVTFIDSCGIRALVAAASAARRARHACGLANVNGQPHRALSVAGVLAAFPRSAGHT